MPVVRAAARRRARSSWTLLYLLVDPTTGATNHDEGTVFYVGSVEDGFRRTGAVADLLDLNAAEGLRDSVPGSVVERVEALWKLGVAPLVAGYVALGVTLRRVSEGIAATAAEALGAPAAADITSTGTLKIFEKNGQIRTTDKIFEKTDNLSEKGHRHRSRCPSPSQLSAISRLCSQVQRRPGSQCLTGTSSARGIPDTPLVISRMIMRKLETTVDAAGPTKPEPFSGRGLAAWAAEARCQGVAAEVP